MSSYIDILIREAMLDLSKLSDEAERAGNDTLKYAANRAWRELFDAQKNSATEKLHARKSAS